MIVQEYYDEAVEHGYHSLILMIDYLVEERKVLKMTDDEDKLHHYLQGKFHRHMNQYLAKYEKRKNGGEPVLKR